MSIPREIDYDKTSSHEIFSHAIIDMEEKLNEDTTDSSQWINPLRDKYDIRMPEIGSPCTLILFGATGDLARKKLLPAVYDLANRGLLSPDFGLVAFGRRDWSDDDFISWAKNYVKKHCRTRFREQVWIHLSHAFRFARGTFDDENSFKNLATIVKNTDEERGTCGNHIFYMSIPPADFELVVHQLVKSGLTDHHPPSWNRVIIEKPFGENLQTARELNKTILSVFPPSSVFRIDHYLGKETVQNLLAMRFSNEMFEPLWNSRYIDHIQITMAENIGIESRAGYYDQIGAARDIIQNHLLQLLALITMEEPLSFNAEDISREKIKILSAVTLPDDLSKHTARGQYTSGWQGSEQVVGYLQEKDIPPTSTTETYAAMRLNVNTRRWKGTAFYLRTGKRLAKRVTEIAVVFNKSLCLPFAALPQNPGDPNTIIFRIQPDEGITLRFRSKIPGSRMQLQDVNMDFSYARSFTESSPEAYERLILNVLVGEAPLFPTAREVELSWEILDPIEEYWSGLGKPEKYQAGTWGPREADIMMKNDGRSWRLP